MSSDIRGRVCDDYAIAKHNTWRIGGQVKRVFWPADLADLQTFLAQVSNDEKVLWLGLGSNVLFPDERLDCTVIMTHKGLQSIQALENNRFVVEVGVSCAKLAKKATSKRLLLKSLDTCKFNPVLFLQSWLLLHLCLRFAHIVKHFVCCLL